MPLTLEEILALPDIGQKISYLKKGRKTELPDRCKLWDDWNPERHEIMVDKEKYPDRKVLEKEAEKVFDEKSGKTYEIEAQYKTEPVNRISIPLEQDIVNIQTAFTVGTEPAIDCTPTDDDEKKLLDAVKAVFKSNKIKYQNKKIDDGTREQIVRSVEELWNKSKSDLQLAKVTYDRIQNLYRDSVVTSQRKDEVEAVYKAAVAAERAAHQQYLLVKDGAQKEDKESARSLVDAARSTVNEVQALLMDARLTAPENGQISTIYPKRGELVGAGTPIMSLVVLDDCHVVLNVREDYMHYFRMNETFRGNVPALKVENIEFKIYYISPLGSFATWRSTKQTGTYDMKTFEIHALPLQPVDGLRPGMSVLVNLNELK